jgi:cell wall-associated NlpC family hydrolase
MAWRKPRARRSRWLNVTRVVLFVVAAAFLAVSASGATLALAKEGATAVHVRGPVGANPGTRPALQESSDSAADSGVTTDDDGDSWDQVVGADMPPPTPEAAPKAPAPPPVGEVIVQFAQSYLGYPYVWAGNGPYGFDCSGFTQFVILNTLGIDIGHAVEGQPYAGGAWVDYGAWQPGDLIFFQNTYRYGISHVGIYIGDGLFIHAENPGTGVVISSLYDGYYGPRYWGASRIA